MIEINILEDPYAFEGVPTTLFKYQYGENAPVYIGTVSVKDGEALTIAFIIDSEMHSKGIGKAAFTKGFNKKNADYDIKYILGKWSRSDEFAAFEDYSSTNLTIFKKNYLAQIDPKEAALLTPTGKWGSSVGYNKVKIINNSDDSVEVHFYKELVESNGTKKLDNLFLDLL